MTDITDAQAYAQLQDILHLPPLPAVATQLLQEITQPEADIDKLSALIEQDPGLAARIVGIANSAYFARQREINNVRDAIVRVLGLNIVRGLAIGIALSKPFTLDACPNFDIERYWYRAFMSGTLANQLSNHVQLSEEQKECCFLAGLLHNLGQMTLVHAFPGRMSELFSQWQRNPEQTILELQQIHLAVDEIGAGKLISRNWHLPSCVADVICYRHNTEESASNRPLVEWIAYCGNLASRMFDNPDCELPDIVSAGSAAAKLTNEQLSELLAHTRKQDAQIRALASSLMQGE